jgi:hypothetical protein
MRQAGLTKADPEAIKPGSWLFDPTINLLVDRRKKLRYSPSTIKDLIVGLEGFILGEKEINYIDGSRASVDGRAVGEGYGDGRRCGRGAA